MLLILIQNQVKGNTGLGKKKGIYFGCYLLKQEKPDY
jgi:hypothetical protein